MKAVRDLRVVHRRYMPARGRVQEGAEPRAGPLNGAPCMQCGHALIAWTLRRWGRGEGSAQWGASVGVVVWTSEMGVKEKW